MDVLNEFIASDTFTGVILPLLLTGAFGPAAMSGVCLLLGSPVLRTFVGPVCRGGGKWFSTTTSNLLDRIFGTGSGEKLETALEGFVQFCVSEFWIGANADDKASAALVKASPSAVARLDAAIETAVKVVETMEPMPSKAKEDEAVEHVGKDLDSDASSLAKEALKLAANTVVRKGIRAAVGRLFPH